MNKITHVVGKGLVLTAIAAINAPTNLSMPLSATKNHGASFHNLQSSSALTKTVTLVKELEGFRSSAYVDTDGTVVIGYGMPVIEGKKVKLGDRISPVQAETALIEKLHEIQQQILAAATVELNSHKLVALTSFAFNVGVESLFKSTLFRKLNAGDFLGAANEFPRWNKAHLKGRLVPFAGLTKRRLTERNLFLTAVN